MQAPSGRNDGGSQVSHDVFAVWRVQGGGVDWKDAPVVPNHHKTILLPSADVKTVMDMPDSTGPEKQAKNAAYKALLVANWNSPAMPSHAPPVDGWTLEDIDAYLIAYDAWAAAKAIADAAAATEAGRVVTYVEVTMVKSFPIEFQL